MVSCLGLSILGSRYRSAGSGNGLVTRRRARSCAIKLPITGTAVCLVCGVKLEAPFASSFLRNGNP